MNMRSTEPVTNSKEVQIRVLVNILGRDVDGPQSFRRSAVAKEYAHTPNCALYEAPESNVER